MNLNRLIYLYINERILNRPVGNTSTKKKLQYTHGLEIQEDDMVNLEELLLREEDAMDGEVTDVESDHEEDKGEEDDDMEILGFTLEDQNEHELSRSVALGLLSSF